jgi:hypothetical protein
MTPFWKSTTAITALTLSNGKSVTSAVWRSMKPRRNSSKKKKNTFAVTLPGKIRVRRRGGANAWNACWKKAVSLRPRKNVRFIFISPPQLVRAIWCCEPTTSVWAMLMKASRSSMFPT